MSATLTAPFEPKLQRQRDRAERLMGKDVARAVKSAVREATKEFARGNTAKATCLIGKWATESSPRGRMYYEEHRPLLEEFVSELRPRYPDWEISLHRSLYYNVAVTRR